MPDERVRIAFVADNPGRWFFHCHNVYHLLAGMARGSYDSIQGWMAKRLLPS